jgi:riboflavin biosynthesis pyrimidine reductase
MLVRVEVSEGAAASQEMAGQVRQALVEGLRLRCDVEIVGSGTLATDARKIVDLRRWD